jgi:linoleoyl-CoA desaturase
MKNKTQKITFKKEESCEFLTILRNRVIVYFSEKEIPLKADKSMILKSFTFMLLNLIVIYLLIYFQTSAPLFIILMSLLGFFMSTGTMNIIHDALHGAYLEDQKKNRILGFLMDLIGVSSYYWKKEHTVDHHTFTNINNHDSDLNVPFFLRITPEATYYPIHKFQHLYAPFLYCLNFFHWAYISDFKRIFKIFTIKCKNNPNKREAFFLITFKMLHIFLFLVSPPLFLDTSFIITFIGYIFYLFTASITMTTIFQLAHIVENVDFPLPEENGKITSSFAKHQLATTCNFAPKNKLVGFLFGGLNFQVEHHLFPHLCHVHLKKISPIVEQTAKEFGLPYHKNASFFGALKSHFKVLKKLGSKPLQNYATACGNIKTKSSI